MVKFDLPRFTVLMWTLIETEHRCQESIRAGEQRCLSSDEKSRIASDLGEIVQFSTDLDLDAAAAEARKFIDKLNKPPAYTLIPYGEVAQWLERVRRNVENQLQGKLFMFIPAKEAEYFCKKNLFGQKVTDKFPQMTDDIEEAGKCLGAGRYTAAVFHLMRVMESSVHCLAKKLRVAVNVRDAWGDILHNINNPIRALPQGTAQQKKRRDSFLAIEANLYAVKGAWRNNTMHPKETYTQEEAEEIFGLVRTFMRHFTETIFPG